ncbi:insulinase family protein, partial [Vibrio parahaemolyticus]|uniref:insulinase family protein n=1 Tax=Vibrio parahaemolyticus TaxID=670 RepID=UPI00146C5EEC
RGKSIDVPIGTEESTGILVQVEPLKEFRKLILTFPMPGMEAHYSVKPLSYFAHLVGYEGEGSLTLQLKEKGWITSLSAGGGASGSNYRDFTVSCTLTPNGLDHVDDIVQAGFQYLSMIKQDGLDEWRYLEKQAVLESAFRFQEPSRPMDLVSHLVINMQHYQPEDTVYGDYKMAGYDEELQRSLLRYLTID